jgi:hypothetical protein
MRHTLMVSSDSMYNEIEVEPESEDSKCNDMPDQDSINICVIRDYYTNIKTNIHEELNSNIPSDNRRRYIDIFVYT